MNLKQHCVDTVELLIDLLATCFIVINDVIGIAVMETRDAGRYMTILILPTVQRLAII